MIVIFGSDFMNQFKPLKGYNKNSINHATEDYMEVICKHFEKDGYIRINNLSFKLGVNLAAASKMVAALKKKGLVEYEKYGVIKPTQSGIEFGNYLSHRHEVLKEFFSLINGNEDVAGEIESIEHYLSKQTIENIEVATEILKNSSSK